MISLIKPRAYIFDLDNTLVDSSHRQWDDLAKVRDDKVVPAVETLIEMLEPQFYIVIVSARSINHLNETLAWLEDNYILYDSLHMRDADDIRPDAEVKEDFFHEIEKDFQVLGVFDDDPEAYKGLGVTQFIVKA